MDDQVEAREQRGRAWRLPGGSRRSLTRTHLAGRLFAAALGLAASGAATTAWSHTDPIAMPPDSDYLIRWFQPHSVRPVTNWEIEVIPQTNSQARFIATAQVMPDDSCWALEVPIAQAAAVRIRSVAGGQVSAWSRSTVVPEPGLTVGILSSAGLLGPMARRRRRVPLSPRDRR